jgi:hypothetical protein
VKFCYIRLHELKRLSEQEWDADGEVTINADHIVSMKRDDENSVTRILTTNGLYYVLETIPMIVRAANFQKRKK